jgi:hypothetical protein
MYSPDYVLPPLRVICHDSDTLSNNDLLLLFTLAARLSPDRLMEAKVFLFDSTGSFCTTTLNRFFDMTDRQVVAIANSEVIISGA